MTMTREFAPGGYRFIPGPFQYSGGVAALHGYQIQRMRFRRPCSSSVVLKWLPKLFSLPVGRSPHFVPASCVRRPRSPSKDFVPSTKFTWGRCQTGAFSMAPTNPVARSNVCPAINPPAEPSFFAFSFTIPADADAPKSFVVAGSGETPEGQGSYRERCVRPGDTSPEGIREKARFVLGEMERRFGAFEAGWRDTTATQVYTVHDLYPFLADEIVRRGAVDAGLTWHYCRPPVIELEFEMDCRGVTIERAF